MASTSTTTKSDKLKNKLLIIIIIIKSAISPLPVPRGSQQLVSVAIAMSPPTYRPWDSVLSSNLLRQSCHWNQSNFLWTYNVVRTYVHAYWHLRPTLLGRLRRVDLKTMRYSVHAHVSWMPNPLFQHQQYHSHKCTANPSHTVHLTHTVTNKTVSMMVPFFYPPTLVTILLWHFYYFSSNSHLLANKQTNKTITSETISLQIIVYIIMCPYIFCWILLPSSNLFFAASGKIALI